MRSYLHQLQQNWQEIGSFRSRFPGSQGLLQKVVPTTRCDGNRKCSRIQRTYHSEELGDEWKIVTAVLDPRALGVPASRSRIYAIAWRSSKVQWRPEVHLETVIEALTSRLVADASVFYWMDAPKSTLTPAQVNWLCLVSN